MLGLQSCLERTELAGRDAKRTIVSPGNSYDAGNIQILTVHTDIPTLEVSLKRAPYFSSLLKMRMRSAVHDTSQLPNPDA